MVIDWTDEAVEAFEVAAKAAVEWKRDYSLDDCCDVAQGNACTAIAAAIRALAKEPPK